MPKLSRSAVIEAGLETVWETVRDFNALPKWHPLIADSRIEDDAPADAVGCIRNFNLKDGANIREKLLALSDVEHTFTYSILESPMPVRNYVATMRFLPVSDGDRTFAEWTAEFECDKKDEQEVLTLVGDFVFAGGLKAINESLCRT